MNPAGVPYGRVSDMVLAKEFQIDDYDNDHFVCRKCGGMVSTRPRPFNCRKEPVGWWWCRACQSTHVPLPLNTVKAKRQAQAASGCKKIDSVFKLKR